MPSVLETAACGGLAEGTRLAAPQRGPRGLGMSGRVPKAIISPDFTKAAVHLRDTNWVTKRPLEAPQAERSSKPAG